MFEPQKKSTWDEWLARNASIPFACFLAGILILITVGRPLMGALAIEANDGGILAAIGMWDPPTSGSGFMSPIGFIIGAIIFACFTRFFTSDSWYGIAGGERDNCIYLLTFCVTFFLTLLCVGCMLTRYQAWHS